MTSRGGRKVVVLMTDGGNITGPPFTIATMLTLSSGVPEANRIQQGLCNGIKAAGIEIYVISFLQGDPNQGTQEPLLMNCATPGGRHFYSINSANALSDAFNDITSRMVQVRLTQ